ncbi:lipocalin family protein [Ferruginibacter sp. HRS2-29]|uniref:lipocalin family protein n=1 Tax=Ferruginibacter sp. HRS2-29 TaxID=2487334 RepID=UPI0020CFBA67|nr:lipocalin family protein [Ferruginibacter sp. HRS2-29]MCP9749503.1 hypothetical protein [Ferruginibacter sp. HRS2-29]
MKRILLILSLAAFTFFGCSKSNDPAPGSGCELNETNLAGSYKITAITYKLSSSSPSIDIFEDYLEPCQRDDVYILQADKVLKYNDAGGSCDPPGSYTGVWNLSAGVVTIDGQAFTVTNFTCNSITGTASNIQVAGDKATFTFTRQ